MLLCLELLSSVVAASCLFFGSPLVSTEHLPPLPLQICIALLSTPQLPGLLSCPICSLLSSVLFTLCHLELCPQPPQAPQIVENVIGGRYPVEPSLWMTDHMAEHPVSFSVERPAPHFYFNFRNRNWNSNFHSDDQDTIVCW